ncbi:MAG: hypothetical protein C0410_02740 [Anaerolinea sp.]|nr:hypothetical protein [Anaerolinea sp.]
MVQKLWYAFDPYRKKIRLDHYMVRDIGKYNISNPKGRCLVSYIPQFVSFLNQHPDVGKKGWDPATLPAKMEKLSKVYSRHQMWWESGEMVRQLIEKGYVVDCIFKANGNLIKNVSEYDLIIDEGNNLPKWSITNPTSRKLFYCTGSHWLFHDKEQLIRHDWLFSRRGVCVSADRLIEPNMSPGYANLISIFGNQMNRSTFGSYSEKIRKIWKSSVDFPSKLDSKNWKIARNRFLYFGGPGWVHKGLDLVIEAFLKEPNLQLVICEGNQGFLSVYDKEIANARNITYLGHLDPLGDQFREVMATTCAVVYPSASEGCAGSVVLPLQYGLIPLVTEITGLEIHDTWAPLIGSTDRELIENIRQRCNEIVNMSDKELDDLRYYFWDYAQKNHSRTAYSNSLSVVLDELIGL